MNPNYQSLGSALFRSPGSRVDRRNLDMEVDSLASPRNSFVDDGIDEAPPAPILSDYAQLPPPSDGDQAGHDESPYGDVPSKDHHEEPAYGSAPPVLKNRDSYRTLPVLQNQNSDSNMSLSSSGYLAAPIPDLPPDELAAANYGPGPPSARGSGRNDYHDTSNGAARRPSQDASSTPGFDRTAHLPVQSPQKPVHKWSAARRSVGPANDTDSRSSAWTSSRVSIGRSSSNGTPTLNVPPVASSTGAAHSLTGSRLKRQKRLSAHRLNPELVHQKEKDREALLFVVAELIETEKEYMKALNTIMDVFATPLANERKLLSPTEHASIFVNVEQLAELHQQLASKSFLVDHDTVAKDPAMAAELASSGYREWFERPDVVEQYSLYCSETSRSTSTLVSLKQSRETLSNWLRHTEHKHRKRLGFDELSSFLIRPVQRICKYPLLFKAIEKELAKPSWADEEAFSRGKSSATACTPSALIETRSASEAAGASVKRINEIADERQKAREQREKERVAQRTKSWKERRVITDNTDYHEAAIALKQKVAEQNEVKDEVRSRSRDSLKEETERAKLALRQAIEAKKKSKSPLGEAAPETGSPDGAASVSASIADRRRALLSADSGAVVAGSSASPSNARADASVPARLCQECHAERAVVRVQVPTESAAAPTRSRILCRPCADAAAVTAEKDHEDFVESLLSPRLNQSLTLSSSAKAVTGSEKVDIGVAAVSNGAAGKVAGTPSSAAAAAPAKAVPVPGSAGTPDPFAHKPSRPAPSLPQWRAIREQKLKLEKERLEQERKAREAKISEIKAQNK